MSDSVRPQRRQPIRLPRPWDSPGNNTGVGCHFLLQCMKVKSESEVAQLCPTPSDPMDCSPPGPSVHGIFQARVLQWVAIAFSDNALWVTVPVAESCPSCCLHITLSDRKGGYSLNKATHCTRLISFNPLREEIPSPFYRCVC